MHAQLNPTRMKTLTQPAGKLANRIAATCQTSRTPAYGMVGVEKGLPCSRCNRPSDLVLREIYDCADCEHREERPRTDGIDRAGPGDCTH